MGRLFFLRARIVPPAQGGTFFAHFFRPLWEINIKGGEYHAQNNQKHREVLPRAR